MSPAQEFAEKYAGYYVEIKITRMGKPKTHAGRVVAWHKNGAVLIEDKSKPPMPAPTLDSRTYVVIDYWGRGYWRFPYEINLGNLMGTGGQGPVVIGETKNPTFPHVCPACKAPAYIGFTAVECSKGCR